MKNLNVHWKKLRDPKYIGSYELAHEDGYRDIVVEITDVQLGNVTNGTTTSKETIVFLNNQKPMVLNVTNAKAIAKVTGSNIIADWIGKRIQLTVKKIKAFGDWVDALRVVPEPPKPKVKEDFNPVHEGWNQAVKMLKSGEVTIDRITKKYNVNAENLQKLKDEIK